MLPPRYTLSVCDEDIHDSLHADGWRGEKKNDWETLVPFIEITQCLVCSYVSELRSLMIGCAQDRSVIAKVRNIVHAG
jgi:hypothetical protein